MKNVNFNFASEQESYEGWNEYNEEREAEEFTNKKIEELKKAIKASVWKTGQAIA
jgi:anti-sigma28 factor (negative regulator of flagellin synthesis)